MEINVGALKRFCLAAAMVVTGAAQAQPAMAEDGRQATIRTQPRLLDGDWRSDLAGAGISFDGWLTQFYQGSPRGQGIRAWQYGGKGDLFLTLNGAKLGLWRGLHVTAHGEFLYGEDANALGNRVLLPVNTAMGLPRLGGREQEFSLVVTQAFSEQFLVSVGKFNMLDVIAKTPLLGGGGTDGFQNIALAAPITGVTPPYLVGASVSLKTNPVTWTAFVYDPRNAQNDDVLRNPFTEGATGMLSATLPYRLGGLNGFLGAKAIYSNQSKTDLADVPALIVPPGSQKFVGTKQGSWFWGGAFQQYLFQNPENPRQGWGIFGQFGMSDGNPNPVAWSVLVGIGGTGFLPRREKDRWGVGYFRYSLGSELRDGLKTVGFKLRDEQGVEAFYSVALTPWFSVAGDVQAVQPVISNAPTTVTAALRTKLRF